MPELGPALSQLSSAFHRSAIVTESKWGGYMGRPTLS